ncbi:UNVERIFIED_CONTAM: hypothetical protein FKN15_004132 [Acipenser sinensis]
MSSSANSWDMAVQAWYDEVKDFKYGVGSTNGAVVGHYTQVVWYRSNKVGCAVAHCPGSKYEYFYVCQYCPPGNDQNLLTTPYKAGPSCDDCPSACEDKLCTSGCGENLYMSSSANSWDMAVQAWYDEVKDFKYGVGSTNGAAVGHYTQVVWYRSNKVGCAVAHCPGSKYEYFYVCQYCPPVQEGSVTQGQQFNAAGVWGTSESPPIRGLACRTSGTQLQHCWHKPRDEMLQPSGD